MNWSENNFDDILTRDVNAPIGANLFAVVTLDVASLPVAGGSVDGVTTSQVVAAPANAVTSGDPLGSVGLFTEGVVQVKVGVAGVTADHDVMTDELGQAVNATFGFLRVARALETVASGGYARCLMFARPHLQFGGGQGAEKCVALPLTGAALHAAVVGQVNPEAVDVLVTRQVLLVGTAATGAAKVDTGITSVSILTAGDNLLDGIDVHTAAGAFSIADGDGVNGKGAVLWPVGKWMTAKEISGDVTGLAATLYTFYIIP